MTFKLSYHAHWFFFIMLMLFGGIGPVVMTALFRNPDGRIDQEVPFKLFLLCYALTAATYADLRMVLIPNYKQYRDSIRVKVCLTTLIAVSVLDLFMMGSMTTAVAYRDIPGWAFGLLVGLVSFGAGLVLLVGYEERPFVREKATLPNEARPWALSVVVVCVRAFRLISYYAGLQVPWVAVCSMVSLIVDAFLSGVYAKITYSYGPTTTTPGPRLQTSPLQSGAVV